MTVRSSNSGEVSYNGKDIQVPAIVARRISIRAAEIIKRTAPVGPNNSRMKVKPIGDIGEIGVYFPPQARHLVYLDRGIKPHLMTELRGKTIPIRGVDGRITFRKAKNVGANILARDENGNTTGFKIAWMNPGVEAMDFIQPALQQAVDEWKSGLDDHNVMDMLQDASGQIGKFFSRFERKM